MGSLASLVLIAVLVGFFALVLLLFRLRFFLQSVKTEGIVTEIVPAPAGSMHDGLFAPRVTFTLPDGTSSEFVGSVQTTSSGYAEGQRVPVRYVPSNPSRADIGTMWSAWGPPSVTLLFSAGMVLAGMRALRQGGQLGASDAKVTVAAFAVLAWVCFAWLFTRSLRRKSGWIATTGKILALFERRGEKGKRACLRTVEFIAPNGEKISFLSTRSGRCNDALIGRDVRVLHSPTVPRDAQLDDFIDLWFAPIGLLVFASAFTYIALVRL